MSLVDIAILILKLIVAALQLLDAVLKYPEVIQIQAAPKGSGKPLPFHILACGLSGGCDAGASWPPRYHPYSGNIYCRFCLHILPLNNSPFLAYIWLTFINVIDSSPAFMGMRSNLF